MKMSSGRSWPLLGGGGESISKDSPKPLPPDVIKCGNLKKLKTMKKKFFVLRGDTMEASARLEYYDSKKKFVSNQPAKRSISLKTCFNINKRSDTRHKHVIALYTKNDCFCVVLESEDELEKWLKALLSLQQGEDIPDGQLPKPTFEHVWQVNVQKKELGESKNILGPYHLCLTDRTLTLVKKGTNNQTEFSLQKIRRCGHLDSFFCMEVGQATVTGAGNLWMQAEDSNIAQNMHDAIFSAMTNCSKKGDLVPKSRNRSSSANEASKPITVIQRWPTHAGLTGVRERCDSLPSRARTTSEGTPHLSMHPPTRHLAPSHHSRPHSMYIRGISYSPPVGSSPVSPASGACSTDSAGSSLSMDGEGAEGGWCLEAESRYGHSLTPDEPVILEENSEDYAPWPAGEDEKLNNYMLMGMGQNNTSSLRKYSPNPVKSSSPSQGSFIDVYSPCGSSPLDTTGAYMPMSPGDTRAVYANHSRGSSLAEEGYVPMAPGAHDDGYVDMDHGHSSSKRGEMSSGSSCSITSGTPSTDIRFSEYNLERVSTLISTEEDVTPSERPARAYSVGSRPVNINNTVTRNDTVTAPEPQRVRAFSVGSRGPRARPHFTPSRHSSHSSVEPSEDLMEMDFSRNSKTRGRHKTTFKKPSTSVSSERLTLPSGSGVSSAASSYSTAEGSYMEMSPRSSPKPLDYDVDGTHLATSPPKNNRFASIIGRSPPKSGFHFERKMFLSSSPPVNHASPPLYRVPEADSGYVEMTTGSRDELRSEDTIINNLSSSPRTITRPKSPITNNEYMEMKPGGEAKPVLPKSTQPRVETFPVNESRPQQFVKQTPTIKQPLLTTQNLRTRTSQEDYLDMSLKRKISIVEDNNNTKVIVGQTATRPLDTPKKAPEGYVEMSWSKNKSQRKASLEGGKSENEDYLNMTGSGSVNKRDRRGSRKERNRYSSQPIAIQSSNKEGVATSPVFPFAGRKHSTGTPPKIPCFLPLSSYGSSSPSSSPFSSLGRNRGRKVARRDSKESTTGSGLTTPSGSTTTIFPLNLNSPGSPMKPFNAKQEYEISMCPVDASSGTVKLSHHQEEEDPGNESDYANLVAGANNESLDLVSIKLDADTDEGSTKTPPPSPIPSPPIDRLVEDMSNLSLSVSDVSQRLVEVPSDESAVVGGKVGTEPSHSSSGEKEIHYASLDLVRSSSEDDTGQCRSLKSQTSQTESSSASTPSPNVALEPSFTYAEIDFVASQKLLRH